eukprot:TRINITY_DN59811_c1_g1_i15.p1 TRINITY_DN59811_c1_g1~~TRINITY_DN59811_c1_g1_i15.p1  ORF type:complete len:430 (-),score=58.40 TRINITY_DN59811_c1_g1_i15:477-1766(-)
MTKVEDSSKQLTSIDKKVQQKYQVVDLQRQKMDLEVQQKQDNQLYQKVDQQMEMYHQPKDDRSVSAHETIESIPINNPQSSFVYVKVYFLCDSSYKDAKLVSMVLKYETLDEFEFEQRQFFESRRPRTPRSCFRGPEAWLKQATDLLPTNSSGSKPEHTQEQMQDTNQQNDLLENRALIREKLFVDLQQLYVQIFDKYIPLHPPQDEDCTEAHIVLDKVDSLKLAQLESNSRILKDTKLFIKDYFSRNKQREKVDQVCVMCQVRIFHPEFQRSSQRKLTWKENRDPPPEPLWVSYDNVWGQVTAQIQSIFSQMYIIFKEARVSGIRVKGQKKFLKLEDRVGEVSKDGQVDLEVEMDNTNYDLKLRFSGGYDECTTQCSCGIIDDDGARMIQCELCNAWMHTRCMGIEDIQEAPESFTCSNCLLDKQQHV